MAFKVASLIVLAVTVAAELHHTLFYQDSLTDISAEGEEHNIQNSYSLFRVDGSLHNPPFLIEGEESPWNYLISIANPESSVPTTYPEPVQALPLAAPWTHEAALAYSTSVIPTTAANRVEEIPFGYVSPVAKISVPAGYKIH